MEVAAKYARDYETYKEVYFWLTVSITALSAISVVLNLLAWVRCAYGGLRFTWQNLWAMMIMVIALITVTMGIAMIYLFLV